jgi:hypothetical protein
MVSKRNKVLVKKYGGQVMSFQSLSLPAQLSIAHYMAIDGEAWEVPADYARKPFKALLPWFRGKYGAKKFGYVEIPTEVLTAEVMKDNEEVSRFKDFEEYHRWYAGLPGGIPNHPKKDRWPVILSSFEDETLQDGWHRLHTYYHQGAETIPAVYYP